jgi:hypothetical protein
LDGQKDRRTEVKQYTPSLSPFGEWGYNPPPHSGSRGIIRCNPINQPCPERIIFGTGIDINSNMTPFFRFVNKQAIYRFGIILLLYFMQKSINFIG